MENKQFLTQRIEEALVKIRDVIQLHGGDVEIVDVDLATKTLYVRLSGACVGCAASILTLKIGVERAVTKNVSEIEHVEAVE